MGIASLADQDLLPGIGELVVEKYRVVRLLGSGGMGSVLEARHASLGHSVALKILHQVASAADESSVRFFREARATASLESEHVVRIFDLGTTDQGLPFLVMERLIGFDLGDVLIRIGPFSPALAVECLLQAARGVCHAHEAGIVHRDLKPSNLFLTRKADGRPLVKVLDFGISKLEKDEDAVRLTHTRTMVGSPLYMSPEQVRDAHHVDARTDVWSLGAILYELLNGRPAFDGDTLPSVYASIVIDEPAPIERQDVPEALRELVGRCLTKDRRERIASSQELIAALEPLVASLPGASLAALELPFPARDREDDFLAVASFPGTRLLIETSVAEPARTSETRKRLTPATTPTLSSGDQAARASDPRQFGWSAMALSVALGIGAAALWSIGTRPGVPVAAVHHTYFLDVDTTPSGALVLEQGRVVGRTPLRLPMAEGDSQVRELVFEAEGFLSHAARIEPLTEDRSLAIALVPKTEPAAAVAPAGVASAASLPDEPAPAAAAAAEASPRASAPRPRPSTAKPARHTDAALAPVETEIHLSR